MSYNCLSAFVKECRDKHHGQQKYFLTGITELLFLSLLHNGDSYVYDVTKKIESYSGGMLKISPNTIYTVAYKLEQDGYISECQKRIGKKRVRVYYHIEDSGLSYLEKLFNQYSDVSRGVQLFWDALEKQAENGGYGRS